MLPQRAASLPLAMRERTSHSITNMRRVTKELDRQAYELNELVQNGCVSSDEAEPVLRLLVAHLFGSGGGAASAAHAIAKLCNDGDPALADHVRALGGIEPVVALLSRARNNPDADFGRFAAAALANLTLHNEINQNEIREAGGLQPLVMLLQEGSSSQAARNAAVALANLTDGNEVNQATIRILGAIPLLCGLIVQDNNHSMIVKGAAWALLILADDPANQNEIRDTGAIPLLAELMQSGFFETEAKGRDCRVRAGISHPDAV